MNCFSHCRYMLYDKFDSTSVNMSSIIVAVRVSSAQSASIVPCSVKYDSITGGTCVVDLPATLFSVGRSTGMQMLLQITDQTGMVLATSHQSAVTLVGKPVHDAPKRRSGFAYGPYRPVHGGQQFSVAVFGNAAGQLAKGFLLQVEFNTSLVEYVGYSLASDWRVRHGADVTASRRTCACSHHCQCGSCRSAGLCQGPRCCYLKLTS
jgi:hypothetical protein